MNTLLKRRVPSILARRLVISNQLSVIRGPKRCVLSVVAASFILCLLLSRPSGAVAAISGPSTNLVQLGRYLVFTHAEATNAVARGARVVRETRGLKALVCPPALGKALGLIEDIPVHALDSVANSQVLAVPVQTMGLAGRGRKIVVLDTGYNYNHPELHSSYLGGTNFVHPGQDPLDDNGHGSHVAGIITGDGLDPRAKGIAPETGIIAGKVLDAFGNGYFSDIVAGIYWAVDGPDGYYGTADDFQADAINISVGSQGSYLYLSVFCDAAIPAMTDAIKYAVDRGVLVVVAAGNNGGSGVSLPGCVSYATTVGAIDQSNVLAYFSGIGPAVDLVAPGVGLYSASLGSAYKSLDGTSQATPVVSGAIALLKEAFPNASVADIQTALQASATDLGVLGKDNRYGWGLADAYQALSVLTANLATVALSLNCSNGQMLISWPLNPPGFVLQVSSQPDSPASGWSAVTNPIVPLGSRNTTALPVQATNQFYRLHWQ